MNSESIDLIYLDPPFNSKADYAAPVGSEAAGAHFKDTWTLDDVDVEWINLIEEKHPKVYQGIMAAMTNSDKSYLVYMASRLLEMRRILKETGSIYLHCDPTMSHYLKILMDAIWGRGNFRNEIVWYYTGPSNTKRWFPRKHDIILAYAKSKKQIFNWQDVRVPYKKLNTGNTNGIFKKDATLDPAGKVSEDWWTDFSPVGRLKRERIGYPTQKPLALLERIIKAASNPGDVVFDPFCGCATTMVAADKLDREWIGIDISEKAADLVVRRIEAQQGLWRDIVHRTDIPKRTDLGKLPKYNSKENKTALYGDQRGYCAGCNTHFEDRYLEVDHIIAKAKGGTDHIGNLQLLCGSCNKIKGNRGMEYLMSKLQIR